MARITICDLCKSRMKDDESEQGVLTLSLFKDKSTDKPDTIHAELCWDCSERLLKSIESDVCLELPEKPQKKPDLLADASLKALENSFVGSPVGPTEKEKAHHPTVACHNL